MMPYIKKNGEPNLAEGRGRKALNTISLKKSNCQQAMKLALPVQCEQIGRNHVHLKLCCI